MTTPAPHARIRVLDQFKIEALNLFKAQGFVPIEIEERGDGEARLVFVETAEALLPTLELMPSEWWAIHAVVRGGKRV